jgi:hypothetical protein
VRSRAPRRHRLVAGMSDIDQERMQALARKTLQLPKQPRRSPPRKDAMPTAKPEPDDFSYGVEIIRMNVRTGERQRIFWDGYGLLHELLEEIIEEAQKSGWLEQVPM